MEEEVLISAFKHVGDVLGAKLDPIDTCSGPAVIPLEEIHLSYSMLKMEYRPQKKDGTFDPAVSGCWGRKVGKAC